MRLTLHYRGPLRSNGSPLHKHELRRFFHVQLRTLWTQEPLVEAPKLLAPREPNEYSLLRPMGSFTFAPLVSAEMNATAELVVTLLRPEPPGNLLTQGGDIDNRLKTLFDALTMPRHLNALAIGSTPSADEAPFFCLLEDDNLVPGSTTPAATGRVECHPPLPPSSVLPPLRGGRKRRARLHRRC